MTLRTQIRRRLTAPALLGATLFALVGCGSGDDVARSIGLTRDAPDEFTVTTRAPLSMPPSLALPVPTPGAARPQERTARDSAELTLSPQSVGAKQNAVRTPGEQALLGASGPEADPTVRDDVNARAAQDSSKRSFTDRLMFWKDAPAPGVVVDPTRESQRLRQNDALGQAPNAGDTPIIQPGSHSTGLIDRISSWF